MERLTLLKRAVDSGHRISHVADLDRQTLVDLTHAAPTQPQPHGPKESKTTPPKPGVAQTYIEGCLQTIETLDAQGLQDCLYRCGQAFGHRNTIEAVITPVMNRVGQCWSEGSLRIIHEHFATTIFHAHFCRMLDTPAAPLPHRPRLLIGTPAGQWCHLGALATAVIARYHGWEPIFLGPSLPAEEIAAARSAIRPQMIALSITCRFDDNCLQAEIRRLTDLSDNRCLLVVGGQAAERCRRYVEAVGGVVCAETDALIALLH